MSCFVGGRRGIVRARAIARVLRQQAELAQVASQRRARRGLNADRQQRARVGRVGLADRSVGYAGGGQRPFERPQRLTGRAQDHRVRAARQAGRQARALAGGVDDLGGEHAAWQVISNDDVMMKKRLLDRAVTDGVGGRSNLWKTRAGVNAS